MDTVLYTYRYMWTLNDCSDKVYFKIITDTLNGHNDFMHAILKLDGLDKCSREYLSEINVSKQGFFEPVTTDLLNSLEVNYEKI